MKCEFCGIGEVKRQGRFCSVVCANRSPTKRPCLPLPRLTPEPPPVEGARWISLTKGMFALVDEADVEAVSQCSWSASKAGTKYWYARGRLNGTSAKMHRLLMGATKGQLVDHKNRNTLDNRRQNLRIATNGQNKCNEGIRKDSTSGFKGVTWQGGAWHVRLAVDGKRRSFGSFKDSHEAALMYDKAAREHHGEFAVLNYPDES